MATWGQIVNGIAHDCVGGDDSGPHIAPGYNPNNTAWVKVPDGTLGGATANGDGTYTNAVIAIPDPTPQLSPLDLLNAKLDAIAASLNVDTSAAVATAQAALSSSG